MILNLYQSEKITSILNILGLLIFLKFMLYSESKFDLSLYNKSFQKVLKNILFSSITINKLKFSTHLYNLKLSKKDNEQQLNRLINNRHGSH